MELTWTRENPARWDADKNRVVGGVGAGVFDSRYADSKIGRLLPGEWWRIVGPGELIVGFAWIDVTWGDAEMLVAIDREFRGRGIGAFALEQLEDEARIRGLNYLTNVVRATHPDRDATIAWFEKRGFSAGEDGRHFRRVVRSLPPE